MITLTSITHTYRGEIVPALLDVSLTLGGIDCHCSGRP